MAIISSTRVGVRPFRLDGGFTLQELAQQMRRSVFQLASAESRGWGSITDDKDWVNRAPQDVTVAPGNAVILDEEAPFGARLRARYYWLSRESGAVGGEDAWMSTHRIRAADVIMWDKGSGVIDGVATERGKFAVVRAGLKDLVTSLDDTATVLADRLPQRFEPDFFLWLVARNQGTQQLAANMRLGGINDLSSQDGHLRTAKFAAGATMDRIELAAMVALGLATFGPAKIDLTHTGVLGEYSVELFRDGGFQPFMASRYTDEIYTGEERMLKLIDDLWNTVLPELRSLHERDEDWRREGHDRLKQMALNEVRTLLGI